MKKLARDWYMHIEDAQIEVAEVMNLAKKAEELRVKRLEAESAPKKPAQRTATGAGQRGGMVGAMRGGPTSGGGGPVGQ